MHRQATQAMGQPGQSCACTSSRCVAMPPTIGRPQQQCLAAARRCRLGASSAAAPASHSSGRRAAAARIATAATAAGGRTRSASPPASSGLKASRCGRRFPVWQGSQGTQAPQLTGVGCAWPTAGVAAGPHPSVFFASSSVTRMQCAGTFAAWPVEGRGGVASLSTRSEEGGASKTLTTAVRTYRHKPFRFGAYMSARVAPAAGGPSCPQIQLLQPHESNGEDEHCTKLLVYLPGEAHGHARGVPTPRDSVSSTHMPACLPDVEERRYGLLASSLVRLRTCSCFSLHLRAHGSGSGNARGAALCRGGPRRHLVPLGRLERQGYLCMPTARPSSRPCARPSPPSPAPVALAPTHHHPPRTTRPLAGWSLQALTAPVRPSCPRSRPFSAWATTCGACTCPLATGQNGTP